MSMTPYGECPNPICGTVALMIGTGKSLVFERVDETCQAVRCRWEKDGTTIIGFGSDWMEAVKDCCEKQVK